MIGQQQYANSKSRNAREAEKNERLEAQRKERELRNQQAIEVIVHSSALVGAVRCSGTRRAMLLI